MLMKTKCLKSGTDKRLCCEKKVLITRPNGTVHLVYSDDIVLVKADRNYSVVVVADTEGQEFVSTKPLKHFQEKLCGNKFVRCHRSFIINTSFVTDVNKKEKQVVLRGETAISSNGETIDRLLKHLAM